MTSTTQPPQSDLPNTSDAEAALYRLMSWLSPSYPGGDHPYTHGLEWGVRSGQISDMTSAQGWLEGILRHGSGRADCVLLTHAARANSAGAVAELAELALALCPSALGRRETTARGRAFVEATRASWPCRRLELLEQVSPDALPYPVAVGVTTAGHGIRLYAARLAYLHAFSTSLVSTAVRLVPLTETEGQRLVAALEPAIRDTAEAAGQLPLEGLAGCALLADIASMRQETLASG